MSNSNKKRYLVYLASTVQGLDLERYELQRLMARYGMFDIGFAYRPEASPYNWEQVRSQIDCADLFILLLGDEYGPITPAGLSYVHREFVHAKSANKPVFAFIKNQMPGQKDSEELRRLAGFRHIVMQQSPYKTWHLRDELLAHARSSFSSSLLSIGAGWVPAGFAPTAMPEMATAEEPEVEEGKLSARERQAKSQQLVNLEVTAKVYQGGNLTPEAVTVPARLDQLFKVLTNLLKQGVSEDKLKAQLEKLITPMVSKQLLEQHPQAHAVDDVRITRSQLQKILSVWQELSLIRKQTDGMRVQWFLKPFSSTTLE